MTKKTKKLVGTNTTPGIGHNVGDGPTFTPDQEEILAAGLKVLADVTKHERAFAARRTWEYWKPIARALQAIRDVAKAAKISFPELRERRGYGGLQRDRISRLIKVIDHEPAVEAWRASLTDEQRRDWSSAEAIVRHCPAIPKKSKNGDGAPRKRLTLANARKKIKELEAEIDGLNEQVRELEAAREHAGAAS
jgi:hypothetical protein